MTTHNKHATWRTSMALVAMAMVLTTTTHAVTYEATGIFDNGDTTSWTATAIFPESAMADMRVTISEMDSFIVVTQDGFIAGATYDASEVFKTSDQIVNGPLPAEELDGLLFDGTAPGAAVLGSSDPNGVPIYYLGTDTVTGNDLTMVESLLVETDGILFGDQRIDFDAPQWVFIEPIVPPTPPNQGAVPEPITATLGLMGLGVLGMATRRRAIS